MAKIRSLAPELAEVARTQLNELESRVPEAIASFRTFIESQPHLKVRTDDQFLVAFLRFCNFNQEEAFKRIDYFYTYKTTAKDVLKSRQIDDKVLSICSSGIFATLPNPVGPGGPRIHFTRMSHIDTSKHTVQDIFRFHTFRSEIEINTDDNWVISGVLEIIDFSKIPYSLLRQFEPRLFKKMAAFLEYGVPTNLVGTHIVNASREAQLILFIVRNLMKKKELLTIHTSLASLQQTIGIEYLPEELGGNNSNFDDAVSSFEKLLLSYREYFIEDEQYGVDEKSIHVAGGSCRKADFD